MFVLVTSLFSYGITFGETRNDSTNLRTVNKHMVARAATTGGIIYIGGLSYLSFIWYSDKERVPFHFYNDNRGYLQMDKMGHSFAAYGQSYIAYKWLRKAGLNKAKALLYGGGMGFMMQAPIEVFDGLYKGWGFSWGDMVANTAGSLLLIGQELMFDEQILRYKISFSPSEMSRNAFGYLGDNLVENFAYDYNGHTYWLSMNANRISFLEKLPPWINIAAGYSANGMLGEFENRSYYYNYRLPDYTRNRQFLFSLDIDWQKIPTNSHFLRGLFAALNFVKIPFPAIEINSQGKVGAYWLYF